jgi:hypothetical protein
MKKRSLINGWTVVGSLVIGMLLTLSLFAWLWFYRPAPSAPAPAVMTLLPGPTSTVQFTLTPTVNIYIPTATPRPGDIAVGQYVQIKGTEGQGLKIRSAPGLNSDMVFLGYDSEVFLVKDGPIQKDEYTWWFLVAPYDTARSGWAASEFLSYISSP